MRGVSGIDSLFFHTNGHFWWPPIFENTNKKGYLNDQDFEVI